LCGGSKETVKLGGHSSVTNRSHKQNPTKSEQGERTNQGRQGFIRKKRPIKKSYDWERSPRDESRLPGEKERHSHNLIQPEQKKLLRETKRTREQSPSGDKDSTTTKTKPNTYCKETSKEAYRKLRRQRSNIFWLRKTGRPNRTGEMELSKKKTRGRKIEKGRNSLPCRLEPGRAGCQKAKK